MLSGQITAIIKEHQNMEVRDVIFHPYRPLIFSCGDGKKCYMYILLLTTNFVCVTFWLDGCVKVYTYKSNVEQHQVESDLGVGEAKNWINIVR